jgi:hypothetical protein
MRIRALGLGLGLTGAVLGGVGASSAAYADSTCYTGCTATTDPTPPTTVTPAATGTPAANLVSEPTGGLPFTGADIAEMATVGAGLVVAGGVLVRRGRRRRVVA